MRDIDGDEMRDIDDEIKVKINGELRDCYIYGEYHKNYGWEKLELRVYANDDDENGEDITDSLMQEELEEIAYSIMEGRYGRCECCKKIVWDGDWADQETCSDCHMTRQDYEYDMRKE